MFKYLSTGQIYALAILGVLGSLVCFIAVLDTIVIVTRGHDSKALTILLRAVVGLFGASGAISSYAVMKHIATVNKNGNGDTS